MLNCGDMNELMSLYIDGELGKEERSAFENHIRVCDSCRREFEELKEIVDVCRETKEVELPTGFREELHARLLLVSEQESVRKGRLLLGSKRIRLLSSIAAGILVILLAGSFYDLGLFRFPAQGGKTGSVNMIAQKSESPAAKKSLADSAAGSKTYGSGVQDTQSAGSIAMDVNQPPADAGGTEVARSGSGDIRSSQTMVTFGLAVESANRHTANLTVTVDDPGAAAKSVKELAVQNGGDDKNAVGEGSADGAAVSAGSTPTAGSEQAPSAANNGAQPVLRAFTASADIVLDFTMPYAQYEGFVTSMDSKYGQSSVQVSGVNNEDLSQKLNELIKQEEGMDSDIKKLEDAGDPSNDDKLKQLMESRGSVEAEIEKIRLGTDFVDVTVVLKKK